MINGSSEQDAIWAEIGYMWTCQIKFLIWTKLGKCQELTYGYLISGWIGICHSGANKTIMYSLIAVWNKLSHGWDDSLVFLSNEGEITAKY